MRAILCVTTAMALLGTAFGQDTLPLTREMVVAPEPLTDVTAVPGGTTMS